VAAAENRVLVWTIVATQFAPPFMFSAVAVALPSMGAELNAGATALGLVETLFLAGSLAFLLPIGRLADASDKRTIYKVGLLAFALSSLLISQLSNMTVILVVRFLQGITSAIFGATGFAIVADIVPSERRGRAFGSSTGAIYTGLTLGPIIGGHLIDISSWRAVFVVGSVPLLVGCALIHRWLPSSWRRPDQAIHLPSAVLIVAAVLSLVAGTAMLRAGWIGHAALTTGLILAALFVLWQRRLARPLLDVRALMKDRVLRNALLAQMLLYMNAFSTNFMLSIYLQVPLGRSAQTAGQILAVGSVVMAVIAPIAGRLADRHQPRMISSIGIACILVTCLCGLTLDERSSLPFVALVLLFHGLGYGFFASPNMTLIMSTASGAQVSMTSALSAKARSLGMVAGMLITAMLISVHLGDVPIAEHPAGFIRIMSTMFAILAGVTVTALVVSLRGARFGTS
jgi:MFS family permease